MLIYYFMFFITQIHLTSVKLRSASPYSQFHLADFSFFLLNTEYFSWLKPQRIFYPIRLIKYIIKKKQIVEIMGKRENVNTWSVTQLISVCCLLGSTAAAAACESQVFVAGSFIVWRVIIGNWFLVQEVVWEFKQVSEKVLFRKKILQQQNKVVMWRKRGNFSSDSQTVQTESF